MAMKETKRSLQAYFAFVGVVSLLIGFSEVSDIKKLHGISLPLKWTLAIYVPLISHFVLGSALVVAATQLSKELLKGGGWIKPLLVASGVMMIVNGALVTSVAGSEATQQGIVQPFIGIAITVYLYRSVVRLAAEARAKANIPDPPPPAKVV